MVPGAHAQFQFWYTYSIPLLLSWLPIPWLFYPLCYLFFFPAAQGGSSTHHLFIMAMTLWLVFVGPRKDGEEEKEELHRVAEAEVKAKQVERPPSVEAPAQSVKEKQE